MRNDTIDELRNYLRVVDFEIPKSKEDSKKKSKLSGFEVIESLENGDYLIFYREDESFRTFGTLWDILYLLDREDLLNLYRQVQAYFEYILPKGVGLVLLGDLTTIWETEESSDDDIWKKQEDWEITSWRFYESCGVHSLELEDGTMVHMFAEQRYPLTRDVMIRMLEHGLEVEQEDEVALMVIKLFITWTTEAEEWYKTTGMLFII